MLEGLPPVMWFIRRHMRRHRTCGLSVPQFRALALLGRNPTANLSIVAEHLGSSQPSASRLISGLVARGFVTRTECPQDRRQCALVLSARGKSALQTSMQATQQALAKRIEPLDESQRATIAEAMTVLRQVFETQGS